MKKIFIVLPMLLFAFAGASASEDAGLFGLLYSKMKSSSVSMQYTYSLSSSGVRTVGEGNVVIQDNSFVMKGNGLEIYCDGKTMWVVDPEGKEVMIESPVEGERSYLDNPLLLFVNMQEVFDVGAGVRDGNVFRYSLTPKVSCGIDSASVAVKDSETSPVVTEAHIALDDGSGLDIRIKSMTFNDKKPLTSFYYDISVLDSSWMITDLR